MAAPELIAGVAIHYPGTGPGADPRRSHILVVVKVDSDKGDLIVVPICSQHANCDKTCVLTAAEWNGVLRHASYAAYYQAKWIPLAATATKIRDGAITFLGTVPKPAFDRIVRGITLSPEAEPRLVKAVAQPIKGRVLKPEV